ncbi:MAG: hypothetical protein ACR2PS_08675 [Pseudomonadales bacterium]
MNEINVNRLAAFLFALWIVVLSAGCAATASTLGAHVPDGQACKGLGGYNDDCASGYCLPAPALVCSSDVATGICTNRDYKCALPGAKGGLYGYTTTIGKDTLTCQNPGHGRWGQFCQNR